MLEISHESKNMTKPVEPFADPEQMRLAMRHWVAGVTVVTSVFEGIRHGMTVSSFTSISLTPPMILVSLAQDTRTHWVIQNSKIFGVSILDSSQVWISDRFAGRTELEDDRFIDIPTETLQTGVPFIRGGLAYLECRVTHQQAAGTSTVFFAEVTAAQSRADGDPLVYSNRSYFRLQK